MKVGMLVFLCPLLSLHSVYGQQARILAPQEQKSGQLAAEQPETYDLALKAGDYVVLSIDPGEAPLSVSVHWPDGQLDRVFEAQPQRQLRARFLAGPSGTYRLQLSRPKGTLAAPYTLAFEERMLLAERLAPRLPPQRYRSPRIEALRLQVEGGNRAAADAFWEEVQQEGTPLIEGLEGDSKHVLATFLWRESYPIRGILIGRLPYVLFEPHEYRMVHLSGTDVWHKTLRLRREARFLYQLSPNDPPGLDPESMQLRFVGLQVDPLNPRQHARRPTTSKYELSSVAEMPAASKQQWISERPGVPVGGLKDTKFRSILLGNERSLTVYTPPGYSSTTRSYGLLLVFDGPLYLEQVPTPTILDNLQAEGRIPPTVAVFVGNVKRSQELSCNQQFSDFLATELLPWVREHYRVMSDPKQVTLAGASAGGLAGVCAALQHPEAFGNVISQSGAFYFLGRDPDKEPNYVVEEFLKKPKLPIRFYLEAGADELNYSGDNPLVAGRHLRDVLRAKGYEVHWHQFFGGHNFIHWRGTIADGLLALLGIQPAP